MVLTLVRLAVAADVAIPRPPELEPDVAFWVRVYTEITTNEGFIHDQHNLAVVYDTLHFGADEPVRERQHQVDAARERYQDILRRLGSGQAPQTPDEQRVHDLWPANTIAARFAAAAEDVRFQLGQSDRFRAGLARSGSWETHIAAVLAKEGLPPEIAALPHVESSFDPTAYSKAGAAGLWQFIRSTGRRFLRIDSSVDERMDPFRETEAAAQLLSYNYHLLGTWPLAITAYNHGAEGMRRAREQLGTDDIVRIVRDYRSPSFGFASRNYYASFLAALTIDEDPGKYFGHLERGKESEFHELKLGAPASAVALEHTLNIDQATLRSLNPALRPLVWNGRRSVPGGYVLRLPSSVSQWTPQLLAQRLGNFKAPVPASAPVSAAAPPLVASIDNANYYLVQAGDNLASIATHTGVGADKLMALNSLRDQDFIYEGQRLRLREAAPVPETAAAPATDVAANTALQETREEEQAVVAADKVAKVSEPVSVTQSQGPQLGPDTEVSASADPIDYSVAADDTIHVAAAETLGHYADWLGTSAARLRKVNSLRSRTPVIIGRRIKLEFRTVPKDIFEQRRHEYHERLEAAYFGTHRINGTQVYVARRGDSLWSITGRNIKLPIWLLQQYNPDLDFSSLRPGTQIALPKIEDVTSL